jgi:hypothetical protein
MSPQPITPDTQDVQSLLSRLGLVVPAADLPFLQRTLLRQRELALRLRAAVPPETESAHVFKVVAGAAPVPSPKEGHPPNIDD